MEPRPVVKWAGGKTQLLPYLIQFSPKQFNQYFEPFLGGGALFFKLSNNRKISKAYLNDCNCDLINVYSVIKKNLDELISELGSGFYQNNEEIYYQIRLSSPENEIKRAARFIYLNKTAFNGLYRVNSKGQFNVPFGKYKNPKILDKFNLKAVHEALQKDELTCMDFEEAVKQANTGDFIYFDPPYQPLSKTSNFTSYTAKSFGEADQERLHKCFKSLDEHGCFVMLSNSFSPFVNELYSDYNCHTVMAGRAINCKAEGRGKIKELIVTNYETTTLEMLLSERS
jgi:DNA adenine methylase